MSETSVLSKPESIYSSDAASCSVCGGLGENEATHFNKQTDDNFRWQYPVEPSKKITDGKLLPILPDGLER